MVNKSGLVQAMLELQSSRGSGVFRCERGKDKKQLVLKEGALVYAESNLPQDHLARIMIGIGLLPKDSLKEISSLMKAGKTSEQAIFESCHSNSQLIRGRQEQAVVITASMLEWDNCNLRFYSGQDLISYQLNLNLALSELLCTSARRAVRNCRATTFSVDEIVVPGECFGRKDLFSALSKEEMFVCSLLNEKMSAVDLLSLIPAGEGGPEELLMSLILVGLARLEDKNASSRASNSLVLEVEEMLLRFETANAYEILSVKTDARQDEIQASYHELAKRFHPDRFQSTDFSAEDRVKAEQVFACINTAYSTLRDPASRAGYDETRLTKESKVEAALKAKTACKSEEEAQVEALFREGRLSLAKGDFEQAVEQLKSCVWFRPKKANYNYYLGLAESEMPALLKSAEQHFLKAIELESMSTDTYIALAKLYIKVMLPRKAEMQLQEVLRWDPGNAEAHRMLAEIAKVIRNR
jgi:tetratricopeptide (TPR) repeat protein